MNVLILQDPDTTAETADLEDEFETTPERVKRQKTIQDVEELLKELDEEDLPLDVISVVQESRKDMERQRAAALEAEKVAQQKKLEEEDRARAEQRARDEKIAHQKKLEEEARARAQQQARDEKIMASIKKAEEERARAEKQAHEERIAQHQKAQEDKERAEELARKQKADQRAETLRAKAAKVQQMRQQLDELKRNKDRFPFEV